jgi:protein-disulfide isomerase
MTVNRPTGRQTPPGKNAPPTSRRSARQQRLANREANRSLARASTHGSGGGPSPLILYSAIAVVIGVVVIGFAVFLGSQKAAPRVLADPNPPLANVVTPAGIPTSGRTLGNPDAKVTMDFYEDFQCTACYGFTNSIEPQLVTNYVATGKAKVVFHDFITIDTNPNIGGTESLDAANAALCATDQGKFWPYHDWLYANQYTEGSGAFTKDRLKAIAHQMGGLDNAKFDSCVDSGSHNSDVQAEKPPAGGTGTPTVAVNGAIVIDSSGQPTYDYATVSAALDKALGVSPSPSAGVSPSSSAGPSPSPSPIPSVAPSASPSVKPS